MFNDVLYETLFPSYDDTAKPQGHIIKLDQKNMSLKGLF